MPSTAMTTTPAAIALRARVADERRATQTPANETERNNNTPATMVRVELCAIFAAIVVSDPVPPFTAARNSWKSDCEICSRACQTFASGTISKRRPITTFVSGGFGGLAISALTETTANALRASKQARKSKVFILSLLGWRSRPHGLYGCRLDA